MNGARRSNVPTGVRSAWRARGMRLRMRSGNGAAQGRPHGPKPDAPRAGGGRGSAHARAGAGGASAPPRERTGARMGARGGRVARRLSLDC